MDSSIQKQVFEFKEMLTKFDNYIKQLPDIREELETQKIADAQRIISLQVKVKVLEMRIDKLEGVVAEPSFEGTTIHEE